MISSEDRAKIIEIAKRYRAKRILLFGSNASPDYEGRDIDLAVEGVRPGDFYSFCGELMFSLSKPVDVVDLAGRSKFIHMIDAEGVPLYG
jgi:predicted nucleotidyltransferase